MTPDINDPNNHVPAISPDDDWDDLDAVPEKSTMGLLPRKQDRGLPPKKEAKNTSANRRAARIVELEAPSEKLQEDPAEEEPAERFPSKSSKKTASKSAQKTAKKAAKKAAKKTAKKAPRAGSKKSPKSEIKAVDELDLEQDLAAEEDSGKVLIPPASKKKPNRILNKIGIRELETADIRPITLPTAKQIIQKRAPVHIESDEDIARMRRRFVRGERGDWGEERGGSSMKWMLYTGLGVVGLVVLAVVLSQLGGKKKPRQSDRSLYSQLEATEEKEFQGGDDLKMLELLTNGQNEAKGIYAKFATAKDAGDISELIYNSKNILPLLEKHWNPIGAKEGWTLDDTAVWTVLDRDGMRYGVLEGTHPDFTSFSAYFQQDGEGLKLDWKATTGYGTATFAELKTGKGDGNQLRTRISMSDFYTYSLPEERFRSFRLMSPDGEANLWGYTAIGGELDEEILKIFSRSEITGEARNEAQIILKMERSPDESLPNQWIITELLGLNWLDVKGK